PAAGRPGRHLQDPGTRLARALRLQLLPDEHRRYLRAPRSVNEAPAVETAAGRAAPPRPVATWRRASQLIRAYPEETILPLLVTQLPLAFLNAGAYFFLFYKAFPDAEYDQFNFVKDAPPGLIFGLLLTNAVYSLFSLVGVAATIVSVKAAPGGRPLSLSQSLDPAFTRMGGLLALGVV